MTLLVVNGFSVQVDVCRKIVGGILPAVEISGQILYGDFIPNQNTPWLSVNCSRYHNLDVSLSLNIEVASSNHLINH